MKILIFCLSAVLVLALCSCGDQQSESSGEGTQFENLHGQAGVVDEDSKPNILQIAIGSPDHTTLVAGGTSSRTGKCNLLIRVHLQFLLQPMLALINYRKVRWTIY